jgi:alkylhydroperoxidase/carboxymuconolactone decarboxylase family protein YurZ
MPDVFGYHPTEPTPVEHDLDVLMQEYLWGAIWTRPGLDMKSRIVCALAARVVKGQFDLSVRRMIEGALRYGVSQTEILEVGMQLVFYIGVLPARAFMHIANTVFRSPEFAQPADESQ